MKTLVLILLVFALFSCSNSGLQKQEQLDDYSKKVFYVDKENRKQGTYIEFTMSGDTISVANYKDDQLNGPRRIYSEKGHLLTIEHYIDDQFNGPILTYYDNGNLETKGHYTNNLLDSLFYSYYESGALKEKLTIKNNDENGPFEEYYESGELHYTGHFINGPNEVGLLTEYDKTGDILKKMQCGKYRDEYICQTIWDKENGEVALKFQYDE